MAAATNMVSLCLLVWSNLEASRGARGEGALVPWGANWVLQQCLLCACAGGAGASVWGRRARGRALLAALWAAPPAPRALARLHATSRIVALSLTIIALLHVTLCAIAIRLDFWQNLTLIGATLNEIINFAAIAYIYFLVLLVVSVLKSVAEGARSQLQARGGAGVGGEGVRGFTRLEREFARAHGCVELINECFEGVVLLTVLQSFHCMVSFSHELYIAAVVRAVLDPPRAALQLQWLLCQYIKLYVLAHGGSSLKNEAKKVGEMLYIENAGRKDLRLMLEVSYP
ncbi:hypothetical protein JYU34_006036 [Plutella xylostella]|uniref:Gustatory receptor n=1 Tax=Plutella xylostella TaxID=51655 RepID=A0ABQ7QUU0_PLUXY|nr:hypothetical protein JYU34_006036 [Plutella xylostella]